MAAGKIHSDVLENPRHGTTGGMTYCPSGKLRYVSCQRQTSEVFFYICDVIINKSISESDMKGFFLFRREMNTVDIFFYKTSYFLLLGIFKKKSLDFNSP